MAKDSPSRFRMWRNLATRQLALHRREVDMAFSSDEIMPGTNGYSATVKLKLIVAGRELGLSQVCPDLVFLREACDPLPPSEATIVISVDGVEDSTRVFLPNGIAGPRVAYY